MALKTQCLVRLYSWDSKNALTIAQSEVLLNIFESFVDSRRIVCRKARLDCLLVLFIQSFSRCLFLFPFGPLRLGLGSRGSLVKVKITDFPFLLVGKRGLL